MKEKDYEKQCKLHNKKIADSNNDGKKYTWDYSTKLSLYSKCPKCDKIHSTVDPLLDVFDNSIGFIKRKCWDCF